MKNIILSFTFFSLMIFCVTNISAQPIILSNSHTIDSAEFVELRSDVNRISVQVDALWGRHFPRLTKDSVTVGEKLDMLLGLTSSEIVCSAYQRLSELLVSHQDTFYQVVKSPLPYVFRDSCILCVEKQKGGRIGVGLTENGTVLHWYTISDQCHMVHEKKVLLGEELRGVLMEGMSSGNIFYWAIKILEE